MTSVSYVDDSLFTSSPVASAAFKDVPTLESGLAHEARRIGPRQRSAPAQRQHQQQHGGGSRSG